jgi:DNA-binding MarR family transcriptional regulator
METTSSLSYLLQHVPTTMHRQVDQVLQERLGIGVSQYKILAILQDRPEVQQRFLADSLGQTEASISRQMKLLAERGMLTVQANPKNRREHVAVLTTKGVRVAHAASDTVDEYHQPALDHLSDKERGQLTEALNVLHQYYCQDGRPYACDLPWYSQFHQEVV